MTDKPATQKSVFQTTPQFPDPTAAAEQLMKLAANADAAVRTAAQRAASAEPLPYDPFAVAKAFGSFSMGLWSDPTRLVEAQARGWRDWAALWGVMAARASGETVSSVIEPARGDRRFASPAWSDEPVFDYIKQAYLLASQQLQDLVAETNLDEKTRAQVDFFSKQVLNALSPSNYAHTNPDVVRKTLETGGLNLMTGFSNLLEDLAEGQGLVKRRAPSDFELGRNIAATPGAVVFENDLMQLIQYAPSTDEVYRRPLLFVPPLVNKYYLFDLTPKASYLKWLVDQGHTVFVISWVNPTEQHAAKDLSDYVTDGVLASLDAIQQATGETSVDLVSYCLGGTLSAIAMALLAARGEGERIASATLIASLVDFKNIGEWSVFLGDDDLGAFDRYLDDKGYVEAHDLAKLFSTVRANDLIWSSVVNHYLLGEEARPSDLLWWFDDGSRIPAALLKQYGRLVLQQNKLREPGGVVIDGTPVDLGKIGAPVFVVALKDDHVSAWKETYAGRAYFGGPTRFLLGGSGHNAGMINPPAANKHGYWVDGPDGPDAEAWLAGATRKDGSWWPEWQGWLDAAAGDDKVAAREPGAGKLKVKEAAPGSYVRVKH
jgi:polyhydroxyalkanoate synthase